MIVTESKKIALEGIPESQLVQSPAELISLSKSS